MLKLEKIAKSQELSVLLRARPKIMTKQFAMALSYAVLVHLMALAVFHIAPFKIGFDSRLLPPVRVNLEQLKEQDMQLAQVESEELFSKGFPFQIPMPIQPELPLAETGFGDWDLDFGLSDTENTLFKDLEVKEQLGSYAIQPVFIANVIQKWQLEQNRSVGFQPDDAVGFKDPDAAKAVNPFSSYVRYSTQTVNPSPHFSGPWGKEALVLSPENEKQIISRSRMPAVADENFRFVFSVQIDAIAGEIFWWEVKQTEGGGEAYQNALEQLEKLRFKVDAQEWIVAGEIEILVPRKLTGLQHD